MRSRIAVGALLVALAVGVHGQSGTVDDQRLLGAATDRANWLTYGRDYGNQRFSPLAQIDAAQRWAPAAAWIYQSGVPSTFQATPIVADGVMYVSLPFNHVVALDARTGRELWRYTHKRRTDKMCCGPANRGVAVAYGKVYIGTVDARLVALDAEERQARCGTCSWWRTWRQRPSAPSNSPRTIRCANRKSPAPPAWARTWRPWCTRARSSSASPVSAIGLHLDSDRPGAPHRRGDRHRRAKPARGLLRRFRCRERQAHLAIRFHAGERLGGRVPHDHSGRRAAAARHRAGESVPRTVSGRLEARRGLCLDHARGRSRAGARVPGIGNPSPQMDDLTRPGDNLYTVSLVAVEVETGRLRWYYQQVPHDMWGYDVASPPVLFDARHRRRARPRGRAGQQDRLAVRAGPA